METDVELDESAEMLDDGCDLFSFRIDLYWKVRYNIERILDELCMKLGASLTDKMCDDVLSQIIDDNF
jgi:hypothetical protein